MNSRDKDYAAGVVVTHVLIHNPWNCINCVIRLTGWIQDGHSTYVEENNLEWKTLSQAEMLHDSPSFQIEAQKEWDWILECGKFQQTQSTYMPFTAFSIQIKRIVNLHLNTCQLFDVLPPSINAHKHTIVCSVTSFSDNANAALTKTRCKLMCHDIKTSCHSHTLCFTFEVVTIDSWENANKNQRSN